MCAVQNGLPRFPRLERYGMFNKPAELLFYSYACKLVLQSHELPQSSCESEGMDRDTNLLFNFARRVFLSLYLAHTRERIILISSVSIPQTKHTVQFE